MTERASLLDRPVRGAVAEIGIALLDTAREANTRLDDPDDAEALHDFRVALRRLRSLLRGLRPELDRAVAKKLLRRLRDLTQSTNAARDAEVQLLWINEHRAELGKRAGPGVPWLVARLEDRRARGYAKARAEASQEFRRLDRRLRRALNAAKLNARPDEASLALAGAHLLRELVTELEQEVGNARSPRDDDAIHSARIAGKQLRYLLEPLSAEAEHLGPIIKQLKALQDLLGELHDIQVFLVDLGDAVAEAAAERARRLHKAAVRRTAEPKAFEGPRPGSAGLLAIARLARRVQDELFRRLESEWGTDQLGLLTGELNSFAETLVARVVAPLPPPSPQLSSRPRPPRVQRPPRRARTAPAIPSSEGQ